MNGEIMDIEDAIYKRRSIRRYKQDLIPTEILKKLIDYARIAPTSSNIQSIEYIIVTDLNMREKLFPLLEWAGSLPVKEREPPIGQRPTAYIIVLVNTKIKKRDVDFDVGAAIENILLGAVKFGIGSCWIGSVDREKIRELFKIPDHYDIKHVVSLGFPDEESIIERYEGSFKYWKDKSNVMHVPKRELKEILLKIT